MSAALNRSISIDLFSFKFHICTWKEKKRMEVKWWNELYYTSRFFSSLFLSYLDECQVKQVCADAGNAFSMMQSSFQVNTFNVLWEMAVGKWWEQKSAKWWLAVPSKGRKSGLQWSVRFAICCECGSECRLLIFIMNAPLIIFCYSSYDSTFVDEGHIIFPDSQ